MKKKIIKSNQKVRCFGFSKCMWRLRKEAPINYISLLQCMMLVLSIDYSNIMMKVLVQPKLKMMT